MQQSVSQNLQIKLNGTFRQFCPTMISDYTWKKLLGLDLRRLRRHFTLNLRTRYNEKRYNDDIGSFFLTTLSWINKTDYKHSEKLSWQMQISLIRAVKAVSIRQKAISLRRNRSQGSEAELLDQQRTILLSVKQVLSAVNHTRDYDVVT